MAKKIKSDKKVRVVELFAGVGGFRVGLERAGGYEVVWSNQWEPSTKKQHASEVYVAKFGARMHSNVDIAKVKVGEIPEHDILVGGFPCQDYSVARNLGQAKGINGKKGVLWWQIHRILLEMGKKSPRYLLLENVDRLLKSPASQRGRDFAIMITTLSDLGYAVEWRVINAADYGMPQRRKRVFILAYKKGTSLYKKLTKEKSKKEWLAHSGVLAKSFKLSPSGVIDEFSIEGDIERVSDSFNKSGNLEFYSVGCITGRKVTTADFKPKYDGRRVVLKDVLEKNELVPREFFIKEADVPRWRYLKGAKSEERKTKSGFTFNYTEGAMVFPDALDRPSRTIITAEGGATPSRFKHVIETEGGALRRLMPIELERLCMFPDNHTQGQADTKRAFFMGNALVVGVIERIGRTLLGMLG